MSHLSTQAAKLYDDLNSWFNSKLGRNYVILKLQETIYVNRCEARKEALTDAILEIEKYAAIVAHNYGEDKGHEIMLVSNEIRNLITKPSKEG